jgi:SEC-C motif
VTEKLGRNDPCWCGSGRKYKHCHLNRAAEKPLPFGAIAARMSEAAKVRVCLHPEASEAACGEIISAHTMQRARVLQKLSDDGNHVLTFYPLEPDERSRPILHRTGWRKASTFSAFCSKHDSATFAPLEAVPYTGSKHQMFLIAYRAICWELHQKTRVFRSHDVRRALADRGLPPVAQQEIQEMLDLHNKGLSSGIDDIRVAKERMDEQLIAGDFSTIRALELIFEGPPSVAATGAIMPELSVLEASLQDLALLNRRLDMLAFGCDIRENQIVVVFVFQEGESAPAEYIQSLQKLSTTQLPQFIGQFFFACCENVYFASSWWDSLSDSNRELVSKLVMTINPYYDVPKYDYSVTLVPWREVSRRVV